jgi:phosphate transport system substrate-binding protein
LDTFGETAASEAFCSGDSEIDILALSEPLSSDLQATCEENNVTYLDFELGKQAVVLLGNADDAFTECLTADQVRTIWAATSTDTVTKWNQVNDSFPEQDIYTFAPSLGTSDLADLFLKQSGNPVLPLRTDITERNNDPLYRVAAVSNASGTITFMNWASYQDLEDAQLDRVHLIAIDNDGGCVEPSEETIQSGEYPFIENSLLLVKTSALGRAEVQSVLWYMFSDENYHLIEDAGFSGITLAQLPAIRDDLQDQFAEANAQAVTAGGDVTGAPVFDPLARPNTSDNRAVPEPEITPPVDESTPPVDDQ